MNGDGDGDVGEDTLRPEANNVPAAEPEITKRELITRVGPGSSLNIVRSAQRSVSLGVPNGGSRQNVPNAHPQRQASYGAARPQVMNYRLPVSQQQRPPPIRYDNSPASQVLRQRQGDLGRLSRSPFPVNANGHFSLVCSSSQASASTATFQPPRLTTIRRTVVASSSQAQGQQNQHLSSTTTPEHPAPEQMASASALQQYVAEQAAARAMYVMEGGVNNIDPVTGRAIVAPAGRAAAAPPWMAMAVSKRPRGRPPLRRPTEESQSARTLPHSGPSSFLSPHATPSSGASSSQSSFVHPVEQLTPSTSTVATASSSRPTSSKNRGSHMDPQLIEKRRAEHVEQERQARLRRRQAEAADLMHQQALSEELAKEQADAALQRLVKQQFSGTSNEPKTKCSEKEIEAKEIEWAAKLCLEEKLRIQAATNERVRQETLDRMRTIDRVAKKKKSNDGSGSDPDKLDDEDAIRRRRSSKKREGELGPIVDILIEEDHDLLTDEGQQRVIEAMDKQREEERQRMLEAEARRKACELEIERSKLDGKLRSAQEKEEVDTAVLEIQKKIKEDMERKMALRAAADMDPPRRRRRTKLEMEEERMAFTGLKKSMEENNKADIQKLCMLSTTLVEAQAQSSQPIPSNEIAPMQEPAIASIEQLIDMTIVKEEDEATSLQFPLAQQPNGQLDDQDFIPVKVEDMASMLNSDDPNGLLNQSDSSSDEPEKVHGSRRRKGTKPVKVEAEAENFAEAENLMEEVYSEVVREEIVEDVPTETIVPEPMRQEIYENVAREEIVSSAPESADTKTEESEESSTESSSHDLKITAEDEANEEENRKREYDGRVEANYLDKLRTQVVSNIPPNPRNFYKWQQKLGETFENGRPDHPPLTTKGIDANTFRGIGKHFEKEYETITISLYPKQMFYGEFELEVTHKCQITFVMEKDWPRIELSIAEHEYKVFSIKHIDSIAMAPSLFGGFPPMLSLSTNGLDDIIKELSVKYKVLRPPDTVQGRPIHRCHPNGLFMLLDVCTDNSRAECKIDVLTKLKTFKYSVSIDTAFDVLDTFYQLALALHPMIDNHKTKFLMLDETMVWDYCNHLRLIWVHIIHENRHTRWIAKCREDLTLACDSNFVEFDADTQLAYSLYPPTHKFRALQRESNTWFDKNYSCRDPFPISFREYTLTVFEDDPYPCVFDEDDDNEGRVNFIDKDGKPHFSTASKPQEGPNQQQHGVKRKSSESKAMSFSKLSQSNKFPRTTAINTINDQVGEEYADGRLREKHTYRDPETTSTASSYDNDFYGPELDDPSTSAIGSPSRSQKPFSVDMYVTGFHPTKTTPKDGDSPEVTAAKAQKRLQRNIIEQHRIITEMMRKRHPPKEPANADSDLTRSHHGEETRKSLEEYRIQRFLNEKETKDSDAPVETGTE